MSTPSEIELDLDLQLLPAWAREPASANRFAKYEGGHEDDRRGRGSHFRVRDGMDEPFPRRDRARQDGQRRGAPGRERRGGRGARLASPADRRAEEQRRELVEPPVPLPELNVDFVAEERGVDSLARQIKLRGRAYPLFEIAMLVLKSPDRYQVRFSVRRGEDGNPLQQLFVCTLDESLWLSQEELVDHIMRRHFGTFYQTEKVAIEPPKGTYTFVAQCGMSGIVLGPPNYHDYQAKLHRLHAERFSRMPFDVFKSRVKIVRDETVVKRWIEEQSWRLEFVGLNVPEPVKLPTREEVEQHFRSVHLPNLVRVADEYLLPAGAKHPFMSRGLHLLLRRATEDQRRFPLRLATKLSQQFAARGLQFFKVNRAVHVCVARPHYLDLANTVVSENVQRIIEFVNSHPGITRRQLLDALAPAPETPTPVAAAPASDSVSQTAEAAAPAAPAAQATAVEPPSPTPEQTAVISDLHWLIHQGHIIEFHDGHIEMARQPKPRPTPLPAKEPSASAEPAGAADVGGSTPAEKPTELRATQSPIEPVAAEISQPGTVAIEAPAVMEPTPTPPGEPVAGETPASTSGAPVDPTSAP